MKFFLMLAMKTSGESQVVSLKIDGLLVACEKWRLLWLEFEPYWLMVSLTIGGL